jgi:hypothetical protein
MSYVVTGKSRLEANPSVANRYDAAEWTVEVQPGASVIVTTSDGQQYDISQDFAALMQQMAPPPDHLTCDQSGASNQVVNYFVKPGGADAAFIRLTRAH